LAGGKGGEEKIVTIIRLIKRERERKRKRE